MALTFIAMKKAFLILFVLLSFACTSQKKVLDSWIGSDKHRLIMSWGPPARTTDDGSGGEILIYARHIYAPNLNLNYWEYKMIYANSEGQIYHWRMSRESVAPQQIDVRFLN